MKKLHRISLFLILVGIAFSQEIFSQSRCNSSWSDNKFSMFIHYGLYSQLGGVWMGKPVEQGYSEQILSFGV
ncbi:MAG: alpha-L-fucosidase, partial [Porphyromonadaceae bacterium]|nr:alpha-L-fucosidase [Porphyromonadaceae bacterium]